MTSTDQLSEICDSLDALNRYMRAEPDCAEHFEVNSHVWALPPRAVLAAIVHELNRRAILEREA